MGNKTVDLANLAAGFVFSWDSGDVTLTHSADTLTLAGGVFRIPDGTAAAPTLAGGTGTNTGMYPSTSTWRTTIEGTAELVVSIAQVQVAGTLALGSSANTFLSNEAAAILQQGADAASPIAQTFKGPDGVGTDKAGGDMTVAPGRPTGSGTPGKYKIAVSTPSTTGSSQQALVDRIVVDYGYVSFNPVDAAATPVAATAALKLFAYNKSMADDAVVTLPSVTTCGHGTAHVGGGDPGTAGFPFTHFFVDGSGNVVLLDATTAADVSANSDTDGDLCIGTADPQEPVQVKNRLGGVKVINIMFWYD